MKPYGHDYGFGWVGKTKDGKKQKYATEREYDEDCEEEENEEEN